MTSGDVCVACASVPLGRTSPCNSRNPSISLAAVNFLIIVFLPLDRRSGVKKSGKSFYHFNTRAEMWEKRLKRRGGAQADCRGLRLKLCLLLAQRNSGTFSSAKKVVCFEANSKGCKS